MLWHPFVLVAEAGKHNNGDAATNAGAQKNPTDDLIFKK